MIELMLLRHAKSSWSGTELPDMDRPLSKRGKQAAQAMGRLMAAKGPAPGLVLCSPARRARDTWKIVGEELKSAPRVLVDDAIYDFGNGGKLLECIRARGGNIPTLMVVGHNPSMERLAQRLVSGGDGKLRQRMEQKYPTAALAVIGFDLEDWAGLEDGAGTLQRFVRPRDIMPDADG
jgi:phosphohistidine phosphatase